MNKSEINKIRLQNLQKIIENYKLENNKKYIDKFSEVLVENKLTGQEKYFGRTKFMTPVIFDLEKCIPGEIVNIEVSSINQKNLFGFNKTNKVFAA